MTKPPYGEPINMQIFLFPQIIKMAADNVNKIFNTAAGHEETTLNFWRVTIIQTIAPYLWLFAVGRHNTMITKSTRENRKCQKASSSHNSDQSYKNTTITRTKEFQHLG